MMGRQLNAHYCTLSSNLRLMVRLLLIMTLMHFGDAGIKNGSFLVITAHFLGKFLIALILICNAA